MAEIDWLQKHKDEKERKSALNTRRDNDAALITSYKYIMSDIGDTKIKNMINVTMNRLKVFSAYVEASLNKADEKVVVESEDKKIDTAKIEEIILAAFASADNRLEKRGDFLLDPYLDQQSCRRGETSAQVLFQLMPAKEGKEPYLDTNITPNDARYITYERGEVGLAWHAYETTKTKGIIESEAWAIEKNFTITGKEAEVVNLWHPKENIIYVGGDEAYKQPNPYGYVPDCVQKVPIGSMLADKGNVEYQCESIFFLVRDLIDEYNRCVSILQTLNFRAVEGALQEATADGGRGKPHDFDDMTAPGSNVAVPTPNAITMIPYGDARNAMIMALDEINKALNDGTLSRITLGDLPGEMSAIALVQIEQGQGQVFMPRLGTRGLLKEQISEMFINQIIQMGGSFELGIPGHKKTYKVSDLDGEYTIKFVYSNKNPETDFARLSIAKQYKEADMLDELSILTDIMKRDDPEGDLRKLNRQRLRAISPNLVIFDGLMALSEAVDDGDESAKAEMVIMEAELGVSAEQILSGQLPQAQQPTVAGEVPGLTPLGKSSAQKAADLKRTPIEGVEE